LIWFLVFGQAERRSFGATVSANFLGRAAAAEYDLLEWICRREEEETLPRLNEIKKKNNREMRERNRDKGVPLLSDVDGLKMVEPTLLKMPRTPFTIYYAIDCSERTRNQSLHATAFYTTNCIISEVY
jgi:hypothetical protein